MITERKDGREPAHNEAGDRKYTGNPQKFEHCGPETQATIGAWARSGSPISHVILLHYLRTNQIPNEDLPIFVISAMIRADKEGFDLMREVNVRMAELRSPGHAAALAARRANPYGAVESQGS